MPRRMFRCIFATTAARGSRTHSTKDAHPLLAMFMRHSALMILYKRFSAELDDLEVRIYDCPAVTEDALLSESGSHRLEYSSSP